VSDIILEMSVILTMDIFIDEGEKPATAEATAARTRSWDFMIRMVS